MPPCRPVSPATCLRLCYALSGTELLYGATQCMVLSYFNWDGVVRGVRCCATDTYRGGDGRILLVTVTNVVYPVSVDVMHKVRHALRTRGVAPYASPRSTMPYAHVAEQHTHRGWCTQVFQMCGTELGDGAH
eukprot:1996026-Rhodomonas_salina.1